MASNIKDNRIYVVEWDDAHTTHDEMTLDEAVRNVHKPARYRARGRLVLTDEVGVTLAKEKSMDEKDVWRGYDFVPRGMVVREYYLDAQKGAVSSQKNRRVVSKKPARKVLQRTTSKRRHS